MQPAKDELNAKWLYWGISDVLDVVSIHKWHTEEIERNHTALIYEKSIDLF